MCDFKGVSLFGREFPGRYLKLEICDLEPDLVFNFPGYEAGEGSFFHVLLYEFVDRFSFLLCILNLVVSLLKSWKEGSSEGWVGLEFISHDQKEGEFANDQVDGSVVSEFSHGEEFQPFLRFFFTEDVEICFEFLVVAFDFSISLWMVG